MNPESQSNVLGDNVLPDLRRGQLALFLGAGVSAGRQSGLPLWAEFRDKLIDGIRGRALEYVEPKAKLALELLRIKPESLLESILDATGESPLADLLSALRGHEPNANHHIIADLCSSGVLTCIVTTNFDCLIESALDARGFHEIPVSLAHNASTGDPNAYVVAASLDEWEAVGLKTVIEPGSGTVAVLKVHGTINRSTTGGRGIVATLRRAAMPLAEPKRQLLDHVLSQFSLLVAGYSGNDQDLLPFFLSRQVIARTIYWNFRLGSPPNADDPGRRVLRALGNRASSLTYDLEVGGASLFGALRDGLPMAAPGEAWIDRAPVPKSPPSSTWADVVEGWCASRSEPEICEVWGGFISLVGDHHEALRSYTEAARRAERAPSAPRDLIRLNLKVGRECAEPTLFGAFSGTFGTADSLDFLRRAASLAAGHGELESEAEAELFLAGLTQLSNREDNPALHLMKSFSLATQCESARILAKWHLFMVSDIGELFVTNFPDFEEIAGHLEEVRQLAQRSGDLGLAANACRRLGRSLLWSFGKPPGRIWRVRPALPVHVLEPVEQLYRESELICRDVGDLEGVAETRQLQSELYGAWNRENDALAAWSECARLKVEVGHPVIRINWLVDLARHDAEIGDQAEEDAHLERAIEIFREYPTSAATSTTISKR